MTEGNQILVSGFFNFFNFIQFFKIFHFQNRRNFGPQNGKIDLSPLKMEQKTFWCQNLLSNFKGHNVNLLRSERFVSKARIFCYLGQYVLKPHF